MTSTATKKGNGKGVILDPAPNPALTEDDERVAAMAAEDEENKVLDLSALAPSRRLVKVPTSDDPEGERFELRLLDDFGIRDQQRLLSWSRQYDQLFNADEDLDASQQEKMEWLLNSMFEMVLDAPKAKLAKIPDAVKNRVVTAFSLAPLLAQQDRERAAARKREQEEKEKAEAESGDRSPTSES